MSRYSGSAIPCSTAAHRLRLQGRQVVARAAFDQRVVELLLPRRHERRMRRGASAQLSTTGQRSSWVKPQEETCKLAALRLLQIAQPIERLGEHDGRVEPEPAMVAHQVQPQPVGLLGRASLQSPAAGRRGHEALEVVGIQRTSMR